MQKKVTTLEDGVRYEGEKEVDQIPEDERKEKRAFLKEFVKGKTLYAKATESTTQVLKEIREGKNINVGKVEEIVASMVDSILENADTMLTLAKIKEYDEYTFKHSLNVAVLTIALAKYLHFSKRELQIIGTGGIMHDCGKMKVPPEILNKPGKLTEWEFSNMKKHPEAGAKLLEETGGFDRRAILMVLQHHEKYAGGGYPNSVPGNKISTFGMMTAIADVYDALTSERVYKKGMPPFNALKILYRDRGYHFHPKLVEHFIRAMGLYPVGSLVRLGNNCIGIVINANRVNLLHPKIMVITDGENNPLPQPRIININPPTSDVSAEWTISDIMEPEKTSQKKEKDRSDIEIVEVLDPAVLNISVEKYLTEAASLEKEEEDAA
ncbi:MAG: HD-GYP domain-containing protein [Candidatus Schekmanbacteria bacterium]|nr:MAG: HD-GYP domain-containing protein [Candidatus Schekmanbacteria bacterium]